MCGNSLQPLRWCEVVKKKKKKNPRGIKKSPRKGPGLNSAFLGKGIKKSLILLIYRYFPPSKRKYLGDAPVPGSARAGTAGNSTSWEMGKNHSAPSLGWEWLLDPRSPLLARGFGGCRSCAFSGGAGGGRNGKSDFSSEALGRAGCDGFEAHQSSAKRSGLWGNIYIYIFLFFFPHGNRPKNTSVECHPALCCHNTFG